MQPILGKFYSRYSSLEFSYSFRSRGFEKASKTVWKQDHEATVSKVRLSDGYQITSYRQLVDEAALVALHNRSHEMFYRGQELDHQDKNGKSVTYPSICRPSLRDDGITRKALIRGKEISDRYDSLYKYIRLYKGKTRYLDEWYIALFQHYEICPTPLIDITQSLRVAATIALGNTDTGYLYVFGLPYPHGSISHYIDQDITLVKLQNVCPVNAYRPRYQEGFLVGKYPIRSNKEAGDNLARRMIAKFRLDNSNNTFWDKHFQPMPKEVMFPEDDAMKAKLKDIKEKALVG